MSGPTSESELFEQLPKGAAEDSRLTQYWSDVRCFLAGILRDFDLAEELVQNTMQTALEKGAAIPDEKLKSWLFTVAHNQAMLHLRKKRVDQKSRQKIGEQQQGRNWECPNLDLSMIQQEQAGHVQQALSTLDPMYRTIVRLRIYEEQTFEQIAQQLNIPIGTALTRMRRALQLLREKLKSCQ